MAEPIQLQHDDDVSDVLERLRARPPGEILLVVPSGSRLAESRFNFQLLALHAEENGQHLVVRSEEERVLGLAAGAGLATTGGRAPAIVAAAATPVTPTGPVPPFEEVGEYRDAGDYDDEAEYDDDDSEAPPRHAYQPRYGPWRSDQFAGGGPRRARDRSGDRRRLLAYGAAAAILLIGIVAAVILLPSATITLTTSSQQFSTPVDLTAQPGSPTDGITVRSETVQKQVSGTFQATGTKDTPGARASGTVQYQDHCGPLSLQVNKGAVVTSTSGVSFVQQQTVTIKADQTKTAPVRAQSEGGNGNVEAGQITKLQNAGIYASCLKVTNPDPTSGG
ncbi:MAG: baseplate J/gp47 family protein, partial [Candidatus Dormibacteraeota bacterium]|nr:baseplate J/gp47 family protein [Candidatus Dormibacteraeota bacterium]